MATAAQAKKVKVRAEYPFCDVAVGETQTLWGVDFVHTEIDQEGKKFHILTAELPVEQASEMFDCGRIAKL